MSTLDQIRKPVAHQISLYEDFLRRSMHNDYGSVATILDYIFSGRGKGIRPLMVILSAALHSEKGESERTYIGAMLIEMIHTASLVHDDVVDEAYVRRGKPSVNALWRSHTAVLVGDYILAKSYSVGLESGAFDIMTYITRSMGQICDGELIQSDQSERLEMTRAIYLDIIYKKTATLIGTSSAVGALAVGAPQSDVDTMKEFGDNLGMAFQIKDDILDFSPGAQTGKVECSDLRERKITLPLLCVLEGATASERRMLMRKLSDVRNTPSNAEYLCEYVISHGGIEHAEMVMQEYTDKAMKLMASYPDGQLRTSMELLCSYVTNRDK